MLVVLRIWFDYDKADADGVNIRNLMEPINKYCEEMEIEDSYEGYPAYAKQGPHATTEVFGIVSIIEDNADIYLPYITKMVWDVNGNREDLLEVINTPVK